MNAISGDQVPQNTYATAAAKNAVNTEKANHGRLPDIFIPALSAVGFIYSE
jgi:hypothetical protein